MTVRIPGTIFEQYHSGWKFTIAYVYGAGYRAFVEGPTKGIALSFVFQPENLDKLYASLRLTHGNQKELGLPPAP